MAHIKVGSVGIGGISRGVHLPGIEASPDLELVAVCDVRPEALEYAQKRYHIPQERCFSDYRDLIACPEVEAIDISTPNDVHFEIAMAAARAGKPYCVEKPMTMSGAQADELAQATEAAGVASMVCFSYRFKAAARYARDLIARGLIGDLYHIDMQYYQAWGLPCCNTAKVWRFDKARTGSGALGDLGSHGLDLVRFVSGQEVVKAVGHTGTFVTERKSLINNEMEPVDVDDFSNYLAQLSGGAAATFRITRFGYGRGNYQTMEIYGSKGALIYTLDMEGNNEDTLDACMDPLGMESQCFTRLKIPAHYRVNQMQCFADLLLGKSDERTPTVKDGQVNMHAVDAVLESARQGRWLSLEER